MRESALKQTHFHGGNTVFLDVDFPHRKAEEQSLLAPIIILRFILGITIKGHIVTKTNQCLF